MSNERRIDIGKIKLVDNEYKFAEPLPRPATGIMPRKLWIEERIFQVISAMSSVQEIFDAFALEKLNGELSHLIRQWKDAPEIGG